MVHRVEYILWDRGFGLPYIGICHLLSWLVTKLLEIIGYSYMTLSIQLYKHKLFCIHVLVLLNIYIYIYIIVPPVYCNCMIESVINKLSLQIFFYKIGTFHTYSMLVSLSLYMFYFIFKIYIYIYIYIIKICYCKFDCYLLRPNGAALFRQSIHFFLRLLSLSSLKCIF